MAHNISHISIVLGMHRSGTSALTRAMHAVGFELPRTIMSPVAGDNAQGFYESTAIMELNGTDKLTSEIEKVYWPVFKRLHFPTLQTHFS